MTVGAVPDTLCRRCDFVRLVPNRRGSVFYKCDEPTQPKYPPQPVLRCAGFVPSEDERRVTLSETHPKILLVVRGLKSRLPKEELERRYRERMPAFREVPGLLQKYYAYDEAEQAWAGIYLFESEEALGGYIESDLRKSIAEAYELVEPPSIERYPIVDVLRT